MADRVDLFAGFATHTITLDGLDFHVRSGGSGPPLLCLHGYPQSHVCWHRMAPRLAERFNVVVMDLRGYGQSSAPAGDDAHMHYAKRTLANDCRGVMQALGHDRFHVMGHDRGGRVAYRLALDWPEAVARLVLLDIVPTVEQWNAMTTERAIGAYHWQFLAQPAPMPETMIAASPTFYLDWTLKGWTKGKSLDVFDPTALDHYRALFAEGARIHAMCEDYRAGATVDRALDEDDRTAARRIAAPTLVLWGSDYLGRGKGNPLEIWRRWCDDVEGQAIDSGHFLAEENPEATTAAVIAFLADVD